MTHERAKAEALQTGDLSMRVYGRTAWNEDDYWRAWKHYYAVITPEYTFKRAYDLFTERHAR